MSIALALDSLSCAHRLTLVLLGRPQGPARELVQWARGRVDVDVLCLGDTVADPVDPVRLVGPAGAPSAPARADDARTEPPVWLHLDGQGAVLARTPDLPVADAGATSPARLAFDVRDPAARLPLPDRSVDGIALHDLLAQVRDAHALLAELHRVARSGAWLQLRVAHGQAPGFWAAPGTMRPWFEGSFAFFAQPALAASPYVAYGGDWQLQAVHCVHGPLDGWPVRPEPGAGRVPQHPPAAPDSRQIPRELVATLVAVHPPRGRDPALRGARITPVHTWGLPDLPGAAPAQPPSPSLSPETACPTA